MVRSVNVYVCLREREREREGGRRRGEWGRREADRNQGKRALTKGPSQPTWPFGDHLLMNEAAHNTHTRIGHDRNP